MDILYKHPSPWNYKLIESHTIVIPYWVVPTVKRYGLQAVDIYNEEKMRDKLSLSDIDILQSLRHFDFSRNIKWNIHFENYGLYLNSSPFTLVDYDTIGQNCNINEQNAAMIAKIASNVRKHRGINADGELVNSSRDEVDSLLRLRDEAYQDLKEKQSFYKIELTSNNFILITIEAGFMNVLEDREGANKFFSDYLKARYACEAIHEVSKTNLFNWYLATLP